MYQPYRQVIEWCKDFANVQCGIAGCKHLMCILRSRGSVIFEPVTSKPQIPCSTSESAEKPNNLKADCWTRK